MNFVETTAKCYQREFKVFHLHLLLDLRYNKLLLSFNLRQV